MANKTVESLTLAGTLTGTENLYVVQGGNSRRVLLSTVSAFAFEVIDDLAEAITINLVDEMAMLQSGVPVKVTMTQLSEFVFAQVATLDSLVIPVDPADLMTVVRDGEAKKVSVALFVSYLQDIFGNPQGTSLSWDVDTHTVVSDTGNDAQIPIIGGFGAGLVPQAPLDPTMFLNGNGEWAVPSGGAGATDLSYTEATRTLISSTGADVVLPLFSDTIAGLVPLSGGGTTNFLRADGTWAAPSGGGGGGTVSADDVTDSATKVMMTSAERIKLDGIATGATNGTSTREIAATSGVTTYIITNADLAGGKIKYFDNTGALVITIPSGLTNKEPVIIKRRGAGAISVVAGSGATLNLSASKNKISNQYGMAVIVPGEVGDNYWLGGELSA